MGKRPQLVALGKKVHGLLFPTRRISLDQLQAVEFKHEKTTVDEATVA
jgi:hypothetical protein